MNLLAGRKAIVTGAGNGIGKEIAKAFYYQGADVAILDIDEKLGLSTVDEIYCAEKSNKLTFQKADVTSEQSIEESFEAVIKEFGYVDILVNNAAIMINHEIRDFPLSDWQKVFDVNMTGVFICSKKIVNHMISKNIAGCILNISSAAARKADSKHAAYSSTKAAMLEFARVLALETGKYGIRVNCILPGATETEMLKGVFEKVDGLRAEIIGKTLLGKLAKPEDQANAAVFLCSDMASHITGEYLVVSGGEFLNP